MTAHQKFVVSFTLDEIIDCDGIDGFNDLVDQQLYDTAQLPETHIIQDITYLVIGAGLDGKISVLVQAETVAALDETEDPDL
jgi:hypothetical protein